MKKTKVNFKKENEILRKMYTTVCAEKEKLLKKLENIDVAYIYEHPKSFNELWNSENIYKQCGYDTRLWIKINYYASKTWLHKHKYILWNDVKITLENFDEVKSSLYIKKLIDLQVRIR